MASNYYYLVKFSFDKKDCRNEEPKLAQKYHTQKCKLPMVRKKLSFLKTSLLTTTNLLDEDCFGLKSFCNPVKVWP